MTGMAVFDTNIGACAIAWSERGVLGVQWPDGDADATRRRLRHRFPDATESEPSMEVLLTIGRIVVTLRGERGDVRELCSASQCQS